MLETHQDSGLLRIENFSFFADSVLFCQGNDT